MGKCFILLVLDDMIEDMADQLKKSHDIEEFSHIALPTQEEVKVVGRICCDSNGKLNAKSVLLEGSVDMSAGKTIPMDLSQLKEYALFPGQVRNKVFVEKQLLAYVKQICRPACAFVLSDYYLCCCCIIPLVSIKT